MIKSDFFAGRNAPSVRTSLVALVVGCVLPLAIVAAVLVFGFNEYVQSQSAQAAISRTRAMTADVDREFATVQATLLALSTSALLQKGDLGGFHAQAVSALANMRAEAIALLEPDGQLLLSTRRPFNAPLPKLTNHPGLKSTSNVGSPTVSDLFLSPITGHPIATISVPVKRNGVLVYVLVATIAPPQLLRILDDQKLPANWIVVITDSSGTVVARTHEMKKFLGKKVSPTLARRMDVIDEDSFEGTTLEGITVRTTFSRSPSTKWTVALGVPMGEVLEGLHHSLLWLSFASLTAIAFGLLVAWYIGGRITTSVSALTAPALALRQGEMLPIPPLYIKEAHILGEALKSAGEAIAQATHDSHHDALTGLANRTLLSTIIDQQLTLCRRNASDLTLLYLDLDGFKCVNDTYGHAMGDLLLLEVASRIKSTIRDSDFAARLGGDEFVVVLIQTDIIEAQSLAGRLIDIISAPYQFGDVTPAVSASIGVASYSNSKSTSKDLLKAADCAMYRAKAAGRRQYCTAT